MTPDPYNTPNGAVPLPPPTPEQLAPIPQAPQPVMPQPQPQMQQPQPLQQPVQPAQQQQAPQQQTPLLNAQQPANPNPPVQQMSQAQSIKELKKAVGNSHEILLSATTVFPFTLFPDIITLDREKLTISHRLFFRVAEVTSTRIEDILNVTADVGPFFGSIKITSRFFDDSEPHAVNYLWRHDALRLKRVIQGYIISRQKGIDCSSFGPKQLADMLDKLGQAAPGEDS
ncbi:MAG: hypothetical protein ABWY71_02200 [Candidatus Saccharimonadales bacterium]